jgi:hypothetical protein
MVGATGFEPEKGPVRPESSEGRNQANPRQIQGLAGDRGTEPDLPRTGLDSQKTHNRPITETAPDLAALLNMAEPDPGVQARHCRNYPKKVIVQAGGAGYNNFGGGQ